MYKQLIKRPNLMDYSITSLYTTDSMLECFCIGSNGIGSTELAVVSSRHYYQFLTSNFAYLLLYCTRKYIHTHSCLLVFVVVCLCVAWISNSVFVTVCAVKQYVLFTI